MKIAITGLLLAGAIPVFAQRSQNPLLDQSFWKGQPGVEQVKEAVAKGADPAELNQMSHDPVSMAINSGAPNETVLYLLEQKGNEPSKLTHDGRTYIFWAASKGNVPLMKALIAKGAKTNIADAHGYYVSNFAATTGQRNTEVYDLIIRNGAKLKTEKNHDGANTLLIGVMADSNFALTQYLESKGLSIRDKDAAGYTAFDYAAKSGNIPMMKKLREKGVGFSKDVMLLASQGTRRGGNSLEVFQYLESVGATPAVYGKKGDNPLHNIVRRPGQEAIVRYFLSKGSDPLQSNEDGNTVFMAAAAYNRDTATLGLLRPYAGDINRKNNAGETALSLAARSNSADVMQYLIRMGADVRASDEKGRNLGYFLLESYSRRQSKEFLPKLEVLASNGFSLAQPQADGSTIYHMAVAKNDLELLKMLQPYKADINAKNTEGLTALHRAAMMSKDDVILKYLLEIGADKTLKTGMDETAFELAKDNEYLAKQQTNIEFLK